MAFIKSFSRWDSVTFPINITEYHGGASGLVDMIITFLTHCPDLSLSRKEREKSVMILKDLGRSDE